MPTSTPPHSLLDRVDPAPLFTPLKLGPLALPNRFVLAPMTRQHSPGGVPGPDVAAYYARRAAFGLVITEGTYVDHPSAGASDQVPRMHGEASLAGWRQVVEAVHAAGGRIAPQLWHLGVTRAVGAPPWPEAPVLSPSGLDADGAARGRAATEADLDALVEAFARSAAHARALGFDAVELHGAHGYLLDQFFWRVTNQRTDRWGGPPAGRARFAARVVAAVRAAVGPELPILYRFSQWKGGHYAARSADSPAELEQLLGPLVEAGVTVFHASTRRYADPAFPGSERTLAGWTRQLTGLPVIAVGSVGVRSPFRGAATEGDPDLSLAPLVALLERGELDLVAVGRAALSEPRWVEKLRAGRLGEIRPWDKAHEATLD